MTITIFYIYGIFLSVIFFRQLNFSENRQAFAVYCWWIMQLKIRWKDGLPWAQNPCLVLTVWRDEEKTYKTCPPFLFMHSQKREVCYETIQWDLQNKNGSMGWSKSQRKWSPVQDWPGRCPYLWKQTKGLLELGKAESLGVRNWDFKSE